MTRGKLNALFSRQAASIMLAPTRLGFGSGAPGGFSIPAQAIPIMTGGGTKNRVKSELRGFGVSALAGGAGVR